MYPHRRSRQFGPSTLAFLVWAEDNRSPVPSQRYPTVEIADKAGRAGYPAQAYEDQSRTQPKKQMVFGQPSWRLASAQVEAFVTEMGGHLGPITFDRKSRKLQPYSVAPWAEERTDPSLIPILKALRGDFFCLPFGGNATPFGREKHPVHGETANARWQFRSLEARAGRTCLHLSLATKTRPGRVDKRIWLVDGQNTVYSQHVVSGMSGPMNLGHHAMLKFPDAPGSGLMSTSRFVYGQVFPEAFELPEKGGYSLLKPGRSSSPWKRSPPLPARRRHPGGRGAGFLAGRGGRTGPADPPAGRDESAGQGLAGIPIHPAAGWKNAADADRLFCGAWTGRFPLLVPALSHSRFHF